MLTETAVVVKLLDESSDDTAEQARAKRAKVSTGLRASTCIYPCRLVTLQACPDRKVLNSRLRSNG